MARIFASASPGAPEALSRTMQWIGNPSASHADVRDLAAARRQLDLARADMARARGY